MFAKRMALSLLAVGVTSLIVTAATFALFTAQTTNQNNTFTAGTVTLGSPTPFTCMVNAGGNTNNLAPGDSGACTVSVTYTGSLDAWLGVDVASSGDLFTLDANHAMITAVKSGATTLTPDMTGRYVLGQYSNGQTASAEIDYSFPLAAGNNYQGKSGQISLSFHAVQSRNNTTGSGPTSW
ncbi:MAG TPA: TasA family protein [Symbiobacteriaceae bacterium]|jgi:predicted ribosomally synthesized peptide with SipW-like signal peptide